MTVFAAFGLAVLGIGNTSTAKSADGTSPEPSVTYPIRFEDSAADKVPRTVMPRATVWYPVEFDMPALQRPAPGPSVSYPIGFSTMGSGR